MGLSDGVLEERDELYSVGRRGWARETKGKDVAACDDAYQGR